MVALVDSMNGDHPARPVLVVSNVPNAGGLAKAQTLGVATDCVDHTEYSGDRVAFEKSLQAKLVEAKVDLICLAGFMRVLSAEFIARWEGKILNIHPSLLPKYKGLNTHQRALDAGDKIHGCTVHEVTAALDDGPILGQVTIDVEAGDTAESLAARLLPFEHKLYPAVLRAFVEGSKKTITIRR